MRKQLKNVPRRQRRILGFEPLEVRTVLSAVGVLPGDYNTDGVVDAADYSVWRDSVDQPAGALANDPNAGAGGTIGGAQYSTWSANYGRVAEVASGRAMENLDRGLVATRTSSSEVFLSWRLFALDSAGVAFNVYRIGGPGGGPLAPPANAQPAPPPGPTVKLTRSPVTLTHFADTLPDASYDYAYYVRPVVDGVEQAASSFYLLESGAAVGAYYTVPMRDIGDYDLRHVSVGDLNGDGQYDFVVARRPMSGVASQIVDAYLHDGTFLWSIDLGANSFGTYNIEPSSTTVDIGNWDGIQVYDLDLDGKAEVFLRSANGVVFGDGQTVVHSNDDVQFISAIDGMTGAERARIQVPDDYIADGPMGAMTGVGYLDGERPSLVVKMKNRVGSGPFRMMIAAYDFDGDLTEKWVWKRDAQVGSFADGHNIRIADVDQDGKDEVADIGFVLNGDGTVKYNLTEQGIVHGDRFYIGDFDPGRPGLEGYGVQQNNRSLLMEYYYDAATGEILHTTYGTSVGDNGRGQLGDVDPAHAGFEFWSFYGMYNSHTAVEGEPPVLTQTSPTAPFPSVSLYWDGDLLTETLSTGSAVIDQWNPSTQSSSRVTSLYKLGSGATTQDGYPIYFGDITGDWREEVIYERNDRQALVVFTSQFDTDTRLYSLAQNPMYRNNMTLKGYLQSRNLDYYLGDGMSTPPTPDVHVLDFGDDAAPTVATPAGASQATVTGATVSLTALGADDYGEPWVTYTWAALGPSEVSFSENQSNEANDTTATFSAAGNYTFVVTIRDASGQTATSRVGVTVEQTQQGVAVSPGSTTLGPGGSRQFAAAVVDQFGLPMATQPSFTWAKLSGVGSLSAGGLYTAPGADGAAIVQAAATGYGAAAATVDISSDIDPVAWWSLDETSGTDVSDSSGNGLDGVTRGGPEWVVGKFENALSFDGDDDYVELPASMVGTTSGAVSLWFNTGVNFSDAAHLFFASPTHDGNGGGAETELHLNFLNNERLQFFIRGDGGSSTNVSLTSASNYADGAWHHVVATWDIHGAATLYVDGAPIGSQSHDASEFVGTYATRLGRPGEGIRHYEGLMDDVRLYDVAIGAAQVQAMYDASAPASAAAAGATGSPLALLTAPSRIAELSHGPSVRVENEDQAPAIADDALLLQVAIAKQSQSQAPAGTSGADQRLSLEKECAEQEAKDEALADAFAILVPHKW